MAGLLLPAEVGSLSNIDSTQGEYRDQIAQVGVACRQAFGSEDLAERLMNSTFTLYVNPSTGSDIYVAGTYLAGATNDIILNQQLAAGYSPFSPFKTLQRAFIEAARISVIQGGSSELPNDVYDRVVIRCAAGEHIIDNAPSNQGVTPWVDGEEPTAEQLRAFNSSSRMGIILPRGVSVIGEDLRKTVVRPLQVPSGTGNPSTGRGSIFRTTGGGFFFNFTFKDATNIQSSHHLLHCFEFCNNADLDTYYQGMVTAFDDISVEDIEKVNPGETQIVAPYPDGSPTNATDTTQGSSCYVFNCSLRSDYGLCGMFLDGREVTGFKSMVTAQFTNVSLQRDISAFQLYSSGVWSTATSYSEYISSNINDVRSRISGSYNRETGCYETDYRHFAFKVIGNAVIQEVSCFVIGNAVHHWTASGGECTITNSNSNFGGTALLSSGFRGVGQPSGAFPQDQGFLGTAVRRATRIPQDGSNVRQVSLGFVSSYADGVLTLAAPVRPEQDLDPFGFSLTGDTYIWIENRARDEGPGFIPGDLENSTAIPVRARMAADPWDPAQPTIINVSTLSNNNNFDTVSAESLQGNRVYIRRLVDTRGASEREYSIIAGNSSVSSSRRPPGLRGQVGRRCRQC